MTEDVNAELFESLSRRLMLGHQRVAALVAEPEQKARAARRLIAITDASKHDLQRASQRLDAFLADLDAGRIWAAQE